MQTEWEKAQEWEQNWHNNCVNSLNEELKQLVYAEKMGLTRKPTTKTPYNFDLNGASILDIGGGAYSLLLKCVNFKESFVADPLMTKYPMWVRSRYDELGIYTGCLKGEDLSEEDLEYFDECWIYNVLEHCEDPAKVADNARKLGKIVRVFEWVNVGISAGHIHTLTKENLDIWFGGEGKVEKVNKDGAVGTCWHGVFKGYNYATPSSK